MSSLLLLLLVMLLMKITNVFLRERNAPRLIQISADKRFLCALWLGARCRDVAKFMHSHTRTHTRAHWSACKSCRLARSPWRTQTPETVVCGCSRMVCGPCGRARATLAACCTQCALLVCSATSHTRARARTRRAMRVYDFKSAREQATLCFAQRSRCSISARAQSRQTI